MLYVLCALAGFTAGVVITVFYLLVWPMIF